MMIKNKLKYILVLLISAIFSCNDNNRKTADSSSVSESQTEKSIQKYKPLGKESSYKKELQWTAYKTNEKVAVTGSFKTISLTNTKEDKPLEESLEGANFYFDGTTVTSGDTARDGTLTTFFFKRLSTSDITGSFGKFENNKVIITLSLDGKTTTKEFSYSIKGNSLTIKGSIDILKDFNSQKAFTSLHRACYDLHSGKTWTEVDLTAKISK